MLGQDMPRQVAGEFEDNEWDHLAAFNRDAERLSKAQLLNIQDQEIGFRWSFDAQGHFTATDWLPDDEGIIDACLHTLRPFVLQGEPTEFNKVTGLLKRRIRDIDFQRVVDKHREVFSLKRFQDAIKIVVQAEPGEVVLNSDDALNRWLYGFEYHRDVEKRLQLEQLHWRVPLRSTRAMFVVMVREKGRAVINVRQIIDVLRGGVI